MRKPDPPVRIIQYKMSMKTCQWGIRFLMQDEHENGEDEVGVARPGASANAECREPEPGTDWRVSPIEPAHRVYRMRPEREVRLGGTGAEGAELRRIGQAGTRRGAGLCGESGGDERVVDDALDSPISRPRGGADGIVPTALFRGEVHAPGHRAFGGSGSGARAVERTGHAPDSAARVRAVRPLPVGAVGGISVSHLDNLRASAPTATWLRCGSRRGPRQLPLGSGVGPIREAAPDFCVWPPYIRETGMEPKGCITSTRWMP